MYIPFSLHIARTSRMQKTNSVPAVVTRRDFPSASEETSPTLPKAT